MSARKNPQPLPGDDLLPAAESLPADIEQPPFDPNPPSTALTLPERAKQALKTIEVETQLVDLAGKTTSILVITNTAGREQAHAGVMSLKTKRIDIQSRGKAAREDAVSFSKAIIAEEKRLVAIIEPEELRLQALRDAWDEARRLEREAKAKADRERIAGIHQRIEQDIRCVPMRLAGRPAVEIEIGIKDVVAIEIDDTFAEFREGAAAVHEQALIRLRQMLADRQTHEAEQERLRVEREELARQRAEQDEANRKERERIAAEELEARKKREADEFAAAAERKRLLDDQLAKLRAQQVENERIAKEQQAAARAEHERIAAENQRAQAQREREDAERRERLRVEDEQRAADVQLQQAAIDAQRAELELRSTKPAPATEPEPALELTTAQPAAPVAAKEFAPTLNDIIEIVRKHYSVSFDQSVVWCFNAFNQAHEAVVPRTVA